MGALHLCPRHARMSYLYGRVISPLLVLLHGHTVLLHAGTMGIMVYIWVQYHTH